MTKEYESAAHESTGCRDYAFCRRVGPICAQRHHIGASKLLADCPDEVELAGYFARCSCTRTLAELVDIIVAMEASIFRKGTKGQCRGTLGKRAHAGHVAAMHSVHIQAGGMCLRVGESRYYNKGRRCRTDPSGIAGSSITPSGSSPPPLHLPDVFGPILSRFCCLPTVFFRMGLPSPPRLV